MAMNSGDSVDVDDEHTRRLMYSHSSTLDLLPTSDYTGDVDSQDQINPLPPPPHLRTF